MSLFNSRSFEQVLYHVGAKMKLPYSLLRAVDETYDFLRQPKDFMERRNLAKKVTSGSDWSQMIKPEKGYALLDQETFPGLKELREYARETFYKLKEEQGASHDAGAFITLLSKKEIEKYPKIMDFALSKPMIEMVAGYFGTIPKLYDINFMYSDANDRVFGSQQWHLDKPEAQFVQCFVLLEDVMPENGPFVALDAHDTKEVCKEINYWQRSSLGEGYIGDEEVSKYYSENQLVAFTGKAGDAAIVDTSACFHYGARVRQGKRLMCSFKYVPAHRILDRIEHRYNSGFANNDPMKIKLLTGGQKCSSS